MTVNSSIACDCEPWFDKVEDWYENAPVAVEGIIISREYTGWDDTTWTTDSKGGKQMKIRMDEGAYFKFEVRMTTNYRNITIDSTFILTSKANSSCSSNFEVGQKYIIFASKNDGNNYHTSVCFGSRLSNPTDNETLKRFIK